MEIRVRESRPDEAKREFGGVALRKTFYFALQGRKKVAWDNEPGGRDVLEGNGTWSFLKRREERTGLELPMKREKHTKGGGNEIKKEENRSPPLNNEGTPETGRGGPQDDLDAPGGPEFFPILKRGGNMNSARRKYHRKDPEKETHFLKYAREGRVGSSLKRKFCSKTSAQR